MFRVFVYTFLSTAFVVALLVVIEKIKEFLIPLKQRAQCMIFKFNVLSTHISAKQLWFQGSVKHSPKSSYIISPTLSANGRILRRISGVCGEWIVVIDSGVGVTKPISSVPLFSEIFNIVKTHIMYWISRLYLAGVAAAQLRWHLPNMVVIQRT